MAVAVRSCWRCVRAQPRSRLWRRSTRRVPCERLRSTPARLLLGLRGHADVRLDRPAVAHVYVWEDSMMGKGGREGGPHDTIVRGGWRRHHWRHEIGGGGIPGRGEVHLITDPRGRAWTPGAGLQVVGRGEAEG
jgi:hypothetical protein